MLCSLQFLCRRILSGPRKDGVFTFSSTSDGGGGGGGGGDPTFTISYLTNSCGLSLKDAVSVSKKLRIKSRHSPDAVLDLLTNYGFTNSQISNLVKRWPLVLQSRAGETLSPKLEFFRSIGVPDAVSAEKISVHPTILHRSLEKILIPTYNFLKSLLQSDKKVVNVFARAPRTFVHGFSGDMSRNIGVLRERGAPESSIALLLNNQPSLLMLGREAFNKLMNRASEIGFDSSKIVFVLALQVFANMSETTLKRKKAVYMSCGWSESDVTDAFLKHPHCMNLSENKIKTNMNFLIHEMGFMAGDVARCPVILGYSVERRMRPRLIVSRVLEEKSLLKKPIGFITLLMMSEEKFKERYILHHQEENIPQLLEVYHRCKEIQIRFETMFAIICRRIQIRVPRKDAISIAAHFSSLDSSSSPASKNLSVKSQANSDAVFDLLKNYGFTNAQVSRLVTKWPAVLQCNPDKILFPKLEFFRSIGIPDAVAAQKLSTYSLILQRSLENHLIPSYDYLRHLVQSDKNVLGVFKRAPLAFAVGWPKTIPSKIAILRRRGVSDCSITSLFVKQPSLFLLFSVEKLKMFVERAAEMGFDPSTTVFIGALQVFGSMSDSTLKHKMEVFKTCGWSESDVTAAFFRYPSCMTFSEAKIRGSMDFLVGELGFTPPDVARRPVLLGLSLDCRIRPRWEVTKVLCAKGLFKRSMSVPTISTLLILGEKEFVKRYISAHEEDMPWLLDLYRGKLTLSQMGFDQVVLPK